MVRVNQMRDFVPERIQRLLETMFAQGLQGENDQMLARHTVAAVLLAGRKADLVEPEGPGEVQSVEPVELRPEQIQRGANLFRVVRLSSPTYHRERRFSSTRF
jgi:hypothetical protein